MAVPFLPRCGSFSFDAWQSTSDANARHASDVRIYTCFAERAEPADWPDRARLRGIRATCLTGPATSSVLEGSYLGSS